MPTREQVRTLLSETLDYAAAGARLGIPAGQAYLIATGVPADDPPHENPGRRETVRGWLAARVAADGQMRTAMRPRTAGPQEQEA